MDSEYVFLRRCEKKRGGNSDGKILENEIGDIDFSYGDLHGKLIAHTDSGDISVSGCVDGDMDLKTGGGEVLLELDGDIDDYNYDISVDSGSISLNDEVISGENLKMNYGAKNTIRVDAGFGDVDMEVWED